MRQATCGDQVPNPDGAIAIRRLLFCSSPLPALAASRPPWSCATMALVATAESVTKTIEALRRAGVRKTPLAEKLVARPPFRYIHDIVMEIVSSTGFGRGLYTDFECEVSNFNVCIAICPHTQCAKPLYSRLLRAANIRETFYFFGQNKDSKIAWLNKILKLTEMATGTRVRANAAKVVAGIDPEETNVWLRTLGDAVASGVSTDLMVSTCGGTEPSTLQSESVGPSDLGQTTPQKQVQRQSSRTESAGSKNSASSQKLFAQRAASPSSLSSSSSSLASASLHKTKTCSSAKLEKTRSSSSSSLDSNKKLGSSSLSSQKLNASSRSLGLSSSSSSSKLRSSERGSTKLTSTSKLTGTSSPSIKQAAQEDGALEDTTSLALPNNIDQLSSRKQTESSNSVVLPDMNNEVLQPSYITERRKSSLKISLPGLPLLSEQSQQQKQKEEECEDLSVTPVSAKLGPILQGIQPPQQLVQQNQNQEHLQPQRLRQGQPGTPATESAVARARPTTARKPPPRKRPQIGGAGKSALGMLASPGMASPVSVTLERPGALSPHGMPQSGVTATNYSSPTFGTSKTEGTIESIIATSASEESGSSRKTPEESAATSALQFVFPELQDTNVFHKVASTEQNSTGRTILVRKLAAAAAAAAANSTTLQNNSQKSNGGLLTSLDENGQEDLLCRTRQAIQQFTRAAHPMGQLLEFYKEDAEAITQELDYWTTEGDKFSVQLAKETATTKTQVAALRLEESKVEASIKDELDKIFAIKMRIASNEIKISRLLEQTFADRS